MTFERELVVHIISSFDALSNKFTEEQIQCMNAEFRGTSSATGYLQCCLAQTLLFLKKGGEDHSFFEECLTAMMNETINRYIEYLKFHEFSIGLKPDFLKVYYFLVEVLYEANVLKDLTALEYYLYMVFDGFIGENDHEMQLLNKVVRTSQGGVTIFREKYGLYGGYNTFKLSYFNLKEKHGIAVIEQGIDD